MLTIVILCEVLFKILNILEVKREHKCQRQFFSPYPILKSGQKNWPELFDSSFFLNWFTNYWQLFSTFYNIFFFAIVLEFLVRNTIESFYGTNIKVLSYPNFFLSASATFSFLFSFFFFLSLTEKHYKIRLLCTVLVFEHLSGRGERKLNIFFKNLLLFFSVNFLCLFFLSCFVSGNEL